MRSFLKIRPLLILLGFVLLDRKLPGMIAKDGYRTFDTAMLDSVLAQMYGDREKTD